MLSEQGYRIADKQQELTKIQRCYLILAHNELQKIRLENAKSGNKDAEKEMKEKVDKRRRSKNG